MNGFSVTENASLRSCVRYGLVIYVTTDKYQDIASFASQYVYRGSVAWSLFVKQ